jgi:hypothetical protein
VDFAIGATLALAAGVLATLAGLDRDRAMYPVVMIVIAALYVLFAVMGRSMDALVVELGIAAMFVAAALAGFRSTLWLVVAALAAHGVLDFLHPSLYANPGVPPWWPGFCGAYDIVAAGYLAWLLKRAKVPARAPDKERPGA